MRIQPYETPAGGLECPALFAEVRNEARTPRIGDTLRHFAGNDVVADVVIAGQIAARNRKLPDVRARECVIRIVVRIAHDQVAVDDHQIGPLAPDPGGDFQPVIKMVLLTCAQMKIGDLDDSELIHKSASYGYIAQPTRSVCALKKWPFVLVTNSVVRSAPPKQQLVGRFAGTGCVSSTRPVGENT